LFASEDLTFQSFSGREGREGRQGREKKRLIKWSV
jgi:hypothetical protein